MVFIGLLRGVNVGGRTRLAMQDLRGICESLSWKNVRSYIQSGNVVFETRRTSPARLADRLADALEKHMGARLPVLVRTRAELESALEGSHAFARRRALDPAQLVIVFLERAPGRASSDALHARAQGPEELHLHGRELYVCYPDGIAGSKLTSAVIERTLDMAATVRSLRTVRKLVELAGSAS